MQFSFLAPFFGQLLALMLAISSFAIKKADLNNNYFFILISVGYLIIFIGSFINIFFLSEKKQEGEVSNWLFIATAMCDFFAGYFIAYSFMNLPVYVAIALLQMIYPMSMIFEAIFFNRKIEYFHFILFFILVSISFAVNFAVNETIPKELLTIDVDMKEVYIKYAKAIGCGLVCNLLFLLNTMIQSRFILPNIGVSSFLLKFSACGLVIGGLFTGALYFSEKIILETVFEIYKTKIFYILFYGISIGIFYLATSPFIKAFNPNALNGSTVAQNAYIGLYTLFTLIKLNDYKSWGYLLSFICVILTSIMIVGFEKFDNKVGNRNKVRDSGTEMESKIMV